MEAMNLLFFERLEREIPIAGTENTLVQPHRISSQSKNDVRVMHRLRKDQSINQPARHPSLIVALHRSRLSLSLPRFPSPLSLVFFFLSEDGIGISTGLCPIVYPDVSHPAVKYSMHVSSVLLSYILPCTRACRARRPPRSRIPGTHEGGKPLRPIPP